MSVKVARHTPSSHTITLGNEGMASSPRVYTSGEDAGSWWRWVAAPPPAACRGVWWNYLNIFVVVRTIAKDTYTLQYIAA